MSPYKVPSPTTPLTGKNIRLRLAETSDAEFILSLRLNEQLNRYISKTADGLEKQIAWLNTYKEREKNGIEYYFIVELLDGAPVGTVRIYDFHSDSFCWGSWLIKREAPNYVAIESALNVYEFAFYSLDFERSHFDVRRDNERVIAFHQRFGAQITHSDAENHFFTYGRADYEQARIRYRKYLPPMSGHSN